MTLFGRIDEAIGHGSGLLSQTIGYVIVGIGQGVVFALLVPALDRLLSEDGQGATGWIIAIAVTAVFTGCCSGCSPSAVITFQWNGCMTVYSARWVAPSPNSPWDGSMPDVPEKWLPW